MMLVLGADAPARLPDGLLEQNIGRPSREECLMDGSINYHRKVFFLSQSFRVLSSCVLFLYKTGCASTIQTSLIVFGLLRFWLNLLVRSVVSLAILPSLTNKLTSKIVSRPVNAYL